MKDVSPFEWWMAWILVPKSSRPSSQAHQQRRQVLSQARANPVVGKRLNICSTLPCGHGGERRVHAEHSDHGVRLGAGGRLAAWRTQAAIVFRLIAFQHLFFNRVATSVLFSPFRKTAPCCVDHHRYSHRLGISVASGASLEGVTIST